MSADNAGVSPKNRAIAVQVRRRFISMSLWDFVLQKCGALRRSHVEVGEGLYRVGPLYSPNRSKRQLFQVPKPCAAVMSPDTVAQYEAQPNHARSASGTSGHRDRSRARRSRLCRDAGRRGRNGVCEPSLPFCFQPEANRAAIPLSAISRLRCAGSCLAPWRSPEVSPSQHRLLGHHQSQETTPRHQLLRPSG